MKLIQILNGYQALNKLTEKNYKSFKVVRNLVNLKKKVDEEVEFYSIQEKKIVEAYAVKDDKGNPIILEGGRINLKSIEDKIAFEKEIADLRSVEVDIPKIKIKESDFKTSDDLPTPDECLKLESFIDWED